MLPTSDDSQPSQTNKLLLDKNFQITCSISLIAVLGVASVTPAFPTLAQTLNVDPKNLGLLITVFTLPSLILSPIVGILADRFGRKKIIVPSLFLFGIAGTACAFAKDFNHLLLLRLFEGMGAAPLLPLSITVISDLYTGDQRTNAIGYSSSVNSLGTASYPTIGGALATFGWYYPFFLPILAIPVGLLVLFGLKNPEPQHVEGNFKVYLANAIKVLRNRRLLGLFISSTSLFILLYGAYVTYLPQLLSSSFQAPPSVIGVILSSISVAVTLTSLQLGRLRKKFASTTLIRFSFILYALAVLIIPSVPNVWLLLIPATVFGVGLGIGAPSIQTMLSEIAPRQYLATILSVNGMFFGLGQTLGPLLMGIVFGWAGINSVFYASVGWAILTLVIFRYCSCL